MILIKNPVRVYYKFVYNKQLDNKLQ